jgi:hypothetical protein
VWLRCCGTAPREIRIPKMQKQNFNCLEVAKMVESHFVGVPYITVCTHHVFVLSSAKEDSLVTSARGGMLLQ